MSKVFFACPSHDYITSATLLGYSLFNIESLFFFFFFTNFVMMIEAVMSRTVMVMTILMMRKKRKRKRESAPAKGFPPSLRSSEHHSIGAEDKKSCHHI